MTRQFDYRELSSSEGIKYGELLTELFAGGLFMPVAFMFDKLAEYYFEGCRSSTPLTVEYVLKLEGLLFLCLTGIVVIGLAFRLWVPKGFLPICLIISAMFILFIILMGHEDPHMKQVGFLFSTLVISGTAFKLTREMDKAFWERPMVIACGVIWVSVVALLVLVGFP